MGIYSNYADSISIKGNNISAHSNPTTHYSIYQAYGVGHTIEANTLTSPDIGLYMFASTSFPANNHRVVNNMISAGSDFGIYMDYIDGVNYLHNTVVGKPAFYASTNNTKNLNVKNNIFASYGDYSFEVNSMDSFQNHLFLFEQSVLLDHNTKEQSDNIP